MSQQHYAKYLGKSYPIVLETISEDIKQKPTLSFDGRQFLVVCAKGDSPDYQVLLTRFYQKAAKNHIQKRLAAYQPMIKTKMKGFSIESHADKWGSCNSHRLLTFHWYLMTFPSEAVDYVVVHELCHLEHLNHDRSFWRLVGKLLPDYKAAQALLGPSQDL